eukprot:Gb_06320 [translate_table: standard]
MNDMMESKACLFVLFASVWIILTNANYAQEKQTLLQVKEALEDPTHALDSWDESSASPCKWKGILCNSAGAVTEIHLQNISLSGRLPSGLCNLGSLTKLNLSHNSLHGNFSTEFLNCSRLEALSFASNRLGGPLPDLSCFKAMKSLDLSVNSFYGEFPVSVGNLTNLSSLSIGDNFFLPSKIPRELGQLKQLKWLYLSNCSLIGSIPPFIGNLTELGNLELSENHLTGRIPREIGNLKNLYQLELYSNSLTGEIPPEIGNLSNLRDFDASRNLLSGSIPQELGQSESLTFLQLYKNNLSGPIPEGFGSLKKLFGLSLYENFLTGPLPAKLGSQSNFNMMDVSQNRLSGPLPVDICKRGRLQYFLVLENMFSGQVPESYGYCRSLIRFRINNNNLSGRIPNGMWAFPHVSILDLSSNNFEGPIASNIGNAKNLSELYIQNNRFSGSLPAEIGDASQLTKIDVSGNGFSGGIPSEIGKLSLLNSLLLQENMFTGSIPDSLESCKFLSSINLARNRLSGPIPVSLGSIEVLNYLNLSNNELSGEIPISLASLKLSSIDLSNNSLRGAVPNVLISEANNRSFFENPGLCVGSYQGFNISLELCRSTMKNLYAGRWIMGWIVGAAAIILLVGFMSIKRRWHQPEKVDSSFWDMKSFHKLNFDEHEVLESMDEEHVIGHGGSGTVYRIGLSNGESVAVKKLWTCKNAHATQGLRELKAEVETLGTIRHKNIVKLYCCFSKADSNLLVYEYMPNGNLWESLHGSRGRTVDWPTRHKIALGVAHGLSYLHHDCVPPIIHRDVKSTNILLDSDYQARVADFGFAKILQACARGDSTTAIAGTHGYIAPGRIATLPPAPPELALFNLPYGDSGLLHLTSISLISRVIGLCPHSDNGFSLLRLKYAYSYKVSEKSDVYSFGVVLLELITGKRPVEPEFGDNKDIVYWISRKVVTKEGALEVLDSRICDSFKDEMIQALKIAVRCTSKMPVLRPPMREVVQMLVEANPFTVKMGKGEKVSPATTVVDIPSCKVQYKG